MDQDEAFRTSIRENFGIRAVRREYLPQASYVVTEAFERESELVGKIVIKEEVHGSCGAIC